MEETINMGFERMFYMLVGGMIGYFTGSFLAVFFFCLVWFAWLIVFNLLYTLIKSKRRLKNGKRKRKR